MMDYTALTAMARDAAFQGRVATAISTRIHTLMQAGTFPDQYVPMARTMLAAPEEFGALLAWGVITDTTVAGRANAGVVTDTDIQNAVNAIILRYVR